MELNQLKYVIKVVELESINKAAEALYIAQPSLSASIKKLEAEYGITIFNRSSKGVTLTVEGREFLAYARQVLEQADVMRDHFTGANHARRMFSVSAQHYAFVVKSFANLVEELNLDNYEFGLFETQTHDLIENVATMSSEIGVLYLNKFNHSAISKLLKEKDLVFTELFMASPHVFIRAEHPLAKKKKIKLSDLDAYPCFTYEQGTHNSFYFSEEILATEFKRKSIILSDRATLFNLILGLNGYTISSGILNDDLNNGIIAIPLDVDDAMHIGYIRRKNSILSDIGARYLELLENSIHEYAK
ncbi:MAG: LysR family transcriptional regulator [Lactobacillales bacterium]|jgi:DNA-binding transcriptional LysR family regulator|nr:LysR family transcriptional regulator [Lactobacillales bacterium]